MQLIRKIRNDRATIGWIPGLNLYTLENPWRGNGKDSAIPAGTYRCVRVQSPKFGLTFEVTGVPQRSKILFHWGNTEKDTLGCILLGLKTDTMSFIGDSRLAFSKFLSRYRDTLEFELVITEAYPV